SRYCARRAPHSFPTRRSSDLGDLIELVADQHGHLVHRLPAAAPLATMAAATEAANPWRSEEEPLDWLVVDHYALASAWELGMRGDRKSTRLNSSHVKISYAVF